MPARLLSLAVFLTVLVSFGCSSSSSGPSFRDGWCANDDACGADGTCVHGTCLPKCVNGTCPNPRPWNRTACVNPPGAAPFCTLSCAGMVTTHSDQPACVNGATLDCATAKLVGPVSCDACACPSGQYCQDDHYTCGPVVDIGAACTKDAECGSGNCLKSGVCGVGFGAPCTASNCDRCRVDTKDATATECTRDCKAGVVGCPQDWLCVLDPYAPYCGKKCGYVGEPCLLPSDRCVDSLSVSGSYSVTLCMRP